MKTCPNCQFECTDQDRFCAKCGMPFAEVKTEEPTPEAVEPAVEEAPAAQEIPTFVKPDAEPKAEEAQPQTPAATSQPRTYQAPPRYMPPQGNNGEEPVSVGKWILYHLIPCIPVIGGLVYVIMLFVWAFGNTENTTFRNWARSQLILAGISIVLVVLLIIIMVALGITGAMAFGDVVDNEFYYEYGY